MKSIPSLLAVSLLLAVAWTTPSAVPVAAPAPTPSQAAGGWTTGAEGTLGHVVYPASAQPHVIDLATEGLYVPELWVVILDYESLTIEAGATVRFANHPTRAPVVIRAIGEIQIAGVLNLDGAQGHSWTQFPLRAEPGPGGFRGSVAYRTEFPWSSAGHGPGGGFMLEGQAAAGAGASHASPGGAPSLCSSASPGPTYGSSLLLPLLGGSGGSAVSHASISSGGGGAGGGAILIGSDLSISVSGTIAARGGAGGGGSGGTNCTGGGGGSGGQVRLASPTILGLGGTIQAGGGAGGSPHGGAGGAGWVRLEKADGGRVTITSTPPAHFGPLGEFLPTDEPTVTVSHYWDDVAPAWQAMGQDPQAGLFGTTDETLASAGIHVLKIAGEDVPLGSALAIRVTFTRGNAVELTTHASGPLVGQPITMGQGNGPNGEPSSLVASWTDVEVNFALGVSTVQVRALLP